MGKKRLQNSIKYDKINTKWMGNNPMVGATVSIAVAVEEAMK